MAGAWHGMCELMRHAMAEEWHGRGMAMCELAFNISDLQVTHLHEQKFTFTLTLQFKAEGYSSNFQPTATAGASFTAKSSNI
jgi:hypothetical protein